jgi:hypothetical protein
MIRRDRELGTLKSTSPCSMMMNSGSPGNVRKAMNPAGVYTSSKWCCPRPTRRIQGKWLDMTMLVSMEIRSEPESKRLLLQCA